MERPRPKGRRKGQKKVAGREAFLDRIDEVKELLELGFSMKAIYERKLAHTGMDYVQFTRYVHQFILKDARPKNTSPRPPRAREETKALEPPRPGRNPWTWTDYAWVGVALVLLLLALFLFLKAPL